MSEHNITVEGGSSVRLPTAGKYCDRDIVITAKGSSGGGQVYVDYVTEVRVGETIELSWLGSDEGQSGTPTMTLIDCGENPDIIDAALLDSEWSEWIYVTGISEGKTIITYQYNTEQWEDSYDRTVHVQVNVVSGGGSIESDAEYQYEDTITIRRETDTYYVPAPYDSPGISEGNCTVISNNGVVSLYFMDGTDCVDITGENEGTAILRFDYDSYEPGGDFTVTCTLILTVIVED